MNRLRPAEPQKPGSMDVVRARRRGLPKSAYGALAALLLVAGAIWALRSLTLQHAVVSVDKSTLVTDVAQRGTLVQSVSAPGVFTPERVRVISATQAGVVNRIFVKAGSRVDAGTPIAQMENPSLEAAVVGARSALQVAQANLASAREQAQAAVIAQESSLSDAQAQLQQDRLQAQSYGQLSKRGLVATLEYEKAKIQAQKSAGDVRNGTAQVGVAQSDAQAKVAAAQAQVDEAAAQLSADESQVAALTLVAMTPGIVQSVDIDPGTSVASGAEIARVADERDLKAVLQVDENELQSVAIGMPARIDDGNGVIDGRVAHIAPAASNGSVPVDVTFPGTLPPSARPDANVEGTIVIATIPNALSIARPAGASDGTSVDLFKIVDNGTRAVKVRVRLGRGSAQRIQILSGLAPGDTAIVSDMSNYSNQDELQLR
jgi:HlyD family secretion protein